MTFRLLLVPCALVLWACPEKKPPPPPPSGRCEVDLEDTGLFSAVGSGARAKQIQSPDELVGGPHAHGAVGDYLLENDKIRVVVQGPSREIGPLPYGGVILDADLKRPAGEAGRDQFGRAGLLYAFGRTINATQVEVLDDGANGGPAVIAATGLDALNDYMNIPLIIDEYLGLGVDLVIDPELPLPLRTTTYYVLSPGENRVRVLTAFCNEGADNVVVPLADLLEQGGTTDYFNPTGCKNGLGGNKECLVDPSPWFGFQGDGVAYALRSYKLTDPQLPEENNALLAVSGVVALLAGGKDQSALLSWLDSEATKRPGAFGIIGGSQRNYLRDFLVVRDLGEVTSFVTAQRGGAGGRLEVTVVQPNGLPVTNARVAVIDAVTDKQLTVLVSGTDGKARVDLPAGGYKVSGAVEGRAPSTFANAQVGSSGKTEVNLTLGETRRLLVNVRDPFGAPLSAKVTVLCPGGLCSVQAISYTQHFQLEELPSNVAALGLVPPHGTLELWLPPAAYEVVVSRGPEYSVWPDAWPARAEAVDLTSTDQTLSAVLAHVIDSTGWMSADLHVHAVNSPDSSVPNERRVLSYLAEGVDVLVSTDHDVITDYAPVIRALGAEGVIGSMIGCEVTPFNFGHQNAYPVTRADTPTGGSFDWAGGEGPTLRLDQLYAGLTERFPHVVLQMNHPRSQNMGSLTTLKVDTATGATHADPVTFRMEPAQGATPNDTKLLSNAFHALEVANGTSASTAVLNDWMTFLSRGSVKTATATSDSHDAYKVTGGYSRTYVNLGVDDPGTFDPVAFSAALKQQRATGTNGPFLRVGARRLDAAGQPTNVTAQVGDTLRLNAAAGEKIELTVDVQAPEWMTFDTIEVFTHADGREAVNGQANSTWPPERVHAVRTLDPLALPLEPVPGQNGQSFRRVHVTETFVLTPTVDTWYVVMVRGGAQSRTLFPLITRGVKCTGGVCTAGSDKAYAFSNAILVDADGSGAYDNFPLQIQQGLTMPLPPREPASRKVPTHEELERGLQAMLRHEHE